MRENRESSSHSYSKGPSWVDKGFFEDQVESPLNLRALSRRFN